MVYLTKLKKKNLLTKYHKNESKNYHTENAVMLINVFGTKSKKQEAKKRYSQVQKEGYLNSNNNVWFYKHGHSYYSKLK